MRRVGVLAALTVGLLVVGTGMALFQPWKLWVDRTVDEALPAAVAAPAPDRRGAGTTAPAPAGPVTLASGELISHEHATSGTARLLRLPDGSRVLRLESLNTSNGPDLRVWLTDRQVVPDSAGWHVFDDGAHVSLGKLKGNHGNQNYPVPAGLDLTRYLSVTIWCDRFNVSFGAAALIPSDPI